MLMTIELSNLKIGKTCKPEKIIKKKIFLIILKGLHEIYAIDNRIIPLYVTGTLKHSMHSTFDPKNQITSSMTRNITL